MDMIDWFIRVVGFLSLIGVLVNFFFIPFHMFFEEDKDRKKKVIKIRIIELVVFSVVTVLIHRLY